MLVKLAEDYCSLRSPEDSDARSARGRQESSLTLSCESSPRSRKTEDVILRFARGKSIVLAALAEDMIARYARGFTHQVPDSHVSVLSHCKLVFVCAMPQEVSESL